MKKLHSAWYRSTRRAVAAAAVGFGLGIVAGTAQAACVGDCDANGEVTVTDLIKMVNISLETAPLSGCTVGDANNDGAITVNEIIAAVNNSLTGCPAGATCGNNVKEADEECDNGGTCMGGDNAGTACTKESDCQGTGVCDALGIPGGGLRKICSTDADCTVTGQTATAKCVRCMPFGGDGCAANCTNETTLNNTLKPGVVDGTGITAGTSGAVVNADILTIPLPLEGQNNFVVGKEKDGRIPLVQKPDGIQLPRIPVSTLACACVRGIEFKTCGGAQYEADGQTVSTDCSRDASLCTGKKPCTSVAGPGNAGAGTIGCSAAGLPSINYVVVQNAIKAPPDAEDPAIFTFGGGGPAGSMLLLNASSIGTVVGSCSGSGGGWGADGEFCTADDPIENQGTPSIQSLTTGTAQATIQNANDIEGNNVGPFSITGAVVSCAQVSSGGGTSGSTLAGAFTSLNQATTGDIVVTNAFVSQ